MGHPVNSTMIHARKVSLHGRCMLAGCERVVRGSRGLWAATSVRYGVVGALAMPVVTPPHTHRTLRPCEAQQCHQQGKTAHARPRHQERNQQERGQGQALPRESNKAFNARCRYRPCLAHKRHCDHGATPRPQTQPKRLYRTTPRARARQQQQQQQHRQQQHQTPRRQPSARHHLQHPHPKHQPPPSMRWNGTYKPTSHRRPHTPSVQQQPPGPARAHRTHATMQMLLNNSQHRQPR